MPTLAQRRQAPIDLPARKPLYLMSAKPARMDAGSDHLILRPDHRVTGFAGCNTFTGSWQDEDGRISLGPLVSTRMACADLGSEQRMLGALDGDILAELDGTTLIVTGADGTELLFEARYAR